MKKKLLIGIGVLVVLIIILMATGVLKFSATYAPTPAAPETAAPKTTDVTKASQVNMEPYTSTAFGYSISKPVAWKVDEGSSASGLSIMIKEPKSAAFLSIRAMSDKSMNSAEAITASIAQYRTSLSAQPNTTVTDFQTGAVENNVGGFIAKGTMTISSVPFQFEERGLLATNGRVLIMRAATIPQIAEITMPLMRQMMESFKI